MRFGNETKKWFSTVFINAPDEAHLVSFLQLENILFDSISKHMTSDFCKLKILQTLGAIGHTGRGKDCCGCQD